MVHRQSIIMLGITFTCGLLLGLAIHLPQITSDSTHARDIRSTDPVNQYGDTGSEENKHKEQLRVLLAQSFSQTLDQDSESATVRRVNPEDKYILKDTNIYNNDLNNVDQSTDEWQLHRQHNLDSSKSKLVQSDQEHKHSHQTVKDKPNSNEIDLDEPGIIDNKQRPKLKHTLTVGVLPNGKVNKKVNAVIDIPPNPSNHNPRDKGLQPASAKTHNPSRNPSGQAEDNAFKDQFNHLWETVDAIYWSPQLEHLTPVGFSDTQTAQWRHKVETGRISHLLEGCGRMQNRLVVFDDGSQMCARYRINNDQIQGEVYSYYLAQVLGIENVPPAILDRPDGSTQRWENAQKSIDAAKWNSRKILVLTPYVRDLRKVYIPEELRTEERSITPDTSTLVNKTLDELIELVQWSDLIILDYLTGNVDRVVNNMFNLQWSPGMMSAPTHNLERAGEAGPLIFMDNESGLLHSYRLLDKYSHYHDKMLRAMCIFRKSTADAIKKYHKTGHLAIKMKELFKQSDPLAERLSSLPQNNIHILNQRLAAVYRQIVHCEHKYRHR